MKTALLCERDRRVSDEGALCISIVELLNQGTLK